MWEDETSYSRGETVRTPRTWVNRWPDIAVTVHRLHGVDGAWFLTCYPASFEQFDLRTDDLDEAKREGVRLVRDRLVKMLAFVDRMADSSP